MIAKPFGLLFFAMIFIGSIAQGAKEDSSKVVRLLEEEFRESRSNVIESEKKKRQILSKLFHLKRKIKKMAEEKGNLSYELIVIKSQAKRTAKEIAGLETAINRQKRGLSGRLRTIYKMKGQAVLRILFSAASPQDLERNMRFLSLVAKKDIELIRSFQDNRRKLLSKKDKLQKKVRALLKVKRKIKKSETQLAAEQRKKSQIVQAIEKEKGWYLSQIKELRKRSKNLDLNTESLLNGSLFFEQKGRLAWPVNQVVVQKYGLLQLRSNGVQINHKGVRFSSGGVIGVSSVFAGKVKFLGEVPGYQTVLILDHSDHYYTVYGHLNEVFVKSGQEVFAGQNIAHAGEKGLYFEIRHYSQPEDPERWLGERGLKVSSKHNALREG